MADFIQLRKYVEKEIKDIKETDTKQDVERALDRAFGATMFYISCHNGDYPEVDAWWRTKRDEFWELKRKAPAEKKQKRG